MCVSNTGRHLLHANHILPGCGSSSLGLLQLLMHGMLGYVQAAETAPGHSQHMAAACILVVTQLEDIRPCGCFDAAAAAPPGLGSTNLLC